MDFELKFMISVIRLLLIKCKFYPKNITPKFQFRSKKKQKCTPEKVVVG